jgi:hypothetical protein
MRTHLLPVRMHRHRCIDTLHASNGAACSARACDSNIDGDVIDACIERKRRLMHACRRQHAPTRITHADFASHKSVCAKTARDFFRVARLPMRLRALRGCRKRRTRDVAGAGSWSLDGGAAQWSSSSSNSA